jgi:autotransporter-associated beta strand protein
LSATLADGATYVIANNTTDVPGADLTSGGSATWNGDDAIALERNISGTWTLIDVIGTIGSDPGSGWAVAGTANATVDRRLTRKNTICSPNTNWSTSAGTNTTNSEWNVLAAYSTGAANAGHSTTCAVNFYWNGPNTSGPGPATGGSDSWVTTATTNWISPTNNASGSAIQWSNGTGNVANFANGSGTVTMGTSITAGGTVIGTTGYTFAPNATISLTSPVTLTNLLTVAPATGTTFTMSGVLSGAGGITQNSAGTTLLSGNSTHTGTTTVTSGTIRLGATGTSPNSPLGTTTAGTTVSSGGVLDLNGFTLATAEPLTINGTGISNGGALINSGAAASYSGAVTLGSNSHIGTTGNITLSGVVSGGFSLTKVGSGVLIFTGVNTYSGTTTISNGTLALGAANRISNSSNIILSGGTFSTGTSTGYAETVGTLSLQSNSTIALGTGSHILNFGASNGVSWANSTVLTITGWTGTINCGMGTAGRIFVGSTATALTADQLAQIKFTISGVDYPATLLTSGELVPTLKLVVTNPGPQIEGVGFSVTVTAKDFNNNNFTLGTNIGITLTSGTNIISGTTTGTITSLNHSVTITGVILDAGTNATITASSGLTCLLPGTSGTFDVSASTVAKCPSSTAVTPSAAQTRCVGSAANELTDAITTAGVTGTPTYQYQWYYNTTNSSTVAGATLISGATSDKYTPLTTVSEAGTRYYFCVGYATDNTCGQTNATQALASNAVQVTVNTVPSNPTGSITVSNNPSCGPATLSYTTGFYWQTTPGTDDTKPTSSNYTLNSTGTTYVRAYNGNCWSAGTINTGSVTIVPAPSITDDADNASVTEGNTANFSVTVSNASSYQWQISTDGGGSWSNIATGASYTTPATTLAMDGNKYKCIISGNSPCTTIESAVATLTVTTPPACSPIWEENFDYGCVDNADLVSISGGNWSTISGSNDFYYSTTGLNYSGYSSSNIGGAAEFTTGPTGDIKNVFSSSGINTGSVYASFLINMSSTSSTTDDFFVSLIGDVSNTYHGRVYMQKSGTQFKLGVSKQSSSTSDQQTGLLDFGVTHLVIIKYEFQNLAGNTDPFKLWVFSSGVPALEASAGTPISANTTGTDATNLKAFALRQTNRPKGVVDGIRVGTTWADVACSATPAAVSYTWTGNTSTVWANAGNWSPNTGYPTAIDNITISTSTPNKLNITDCRTVKNFTLNSTGNFDMSATGSLTINGTVTYDDANNAGAASNLNCDSYVYITKSTTGAESITVPPLTYGNLDILGGNRTFLSGKTIKICSGFSVEPDDASPKLYTYTVTGSTVEYISSADWYMLPFTYHNLTFSGTGSFDFGGNSPAANKSVNVLNNYLQSAGTVYLGSVSSYTATLNIDGNMTISGGLFDMNYVSSSMGTVNLKGDLTVASGATLYATGTTAANTNFNFTGTYDAMQPATIQTINVASIGATRNRYVGFNVKTGAYAQLSGSNLELGTGGTVSVEAGSTLDFGFNGSTALFITNVSGATSTGFTMTGNAKLIITHPNGIDRWLSATDRAVDGNVQIVGSRTYSTTGIYHYVGKTPQQRLGDGILFGGISGKYVIVELDALSTNLLLEGNSGTSTSLFNELTDIGLSNTGSGLKIIQGTVVGTATSDFMSTGNLEMTGGLYQIAFPYGTSDVVPRLSGTYTLSGGTIELKGSAAQTLRGGNSPNTPNYYNLKMSGNNTVTINNTPIIVSNNLYITASAIFNSGSNSVTGDAGLTMDGGKWRISKLSNAQPELIGKNTPYALTNGIVELYGTGATDQQQIRGNFRPASPLKVNYYNIEINAAAANYSTIAGAGNVDLNSSFTLSGTMNVNSPAVLRMDEDESIDGGGTFNINDGAGLLYGGSEGSTS